MALKQLCQTLLQCTETLEQEIKTNLNEFHNLVFGKKMDEVKLALERAKDYHYKEMTDAVSEVFRNVKIIIFHQDKLDWLSNEANFTAKDLKRFSYVKRQVYAFSQNEEKPAFSKSVENLAPRTKREIRRTASEVSLGTLEAWEKYLDKKEEGENSLADENIVEVKKTVPKRALSNARARKKFVSSTMGGFLDDYGRRTNYLGSIVEDNISSSEESEDFCDLSTDITSEEPSALKDYFKNDLQVPDESANFEKENNQSSEWCKTDDDSDIVRLNESVTNEENPTDTKLDKPLQPNKINSINNNDNDVNDVSSVEGSPQLNKACNVETYSLVDTINNSMVNEEFIINEIMGNLFSEEDKTADVVVPMEEASSTCQPVEKIKPKIVDVIYKKKPNLMGDG